MRYSTTIRAALAAAVSVQVLVAAFTATGASAQQQQPQYGEGPGVVTRSLPTTGSGDVQQPIYGEGPGVIGKALPKTGQGPDELSAQWGWIVLAAGIAVGFLAVLYARGRKMAARGQGQRVLVVTPGAASH